MTRIEELEKAVALLSQEEYRRFREWFLERDWTLWDEAIRADSKEGKLDFLLEEAEQEKRCGDLREL